MSPWAFILAFARMSSEHDSRSGQIGEYDFIDGDTIIVCFPDGSQSPEMPLRGLMPLPTAKTELRAYARKLQQR